MLWHMHLHGCSTLHRVGIIVGVDAALNTLHLEPSQRCLCACLLPQPGKVASLSEEICLHVA